MGIAVEAMEEEEEEEKPISNPLPPPPRPSKKDVSRTENLSNEDFRRMVMETPRRAEEPHHHHKDRHRRGKKGPDEEDEGEKHGQRKHRPKPKEEETLVQLEEPKYRDRAKERREDQNPDYDHTTAELGLHAVAPPGTVDLRTTDAHKISIENSKFLGGDVEHTHLVKGLDYALLHKVRSEIERKPDGNENADGKRRLPKEDQTMSFRTPIAKLIYQWTIKPEIFNKPNEMFLPGRTAFVFDMDEEFSHDIPTTVHRSKADCPSPQETVTVGVDATVLERIAKIMSYLRLSSSGKMLKKKKREKIEAKVKGLMPLVDGRISADQENVIEEGTANGSSKQHVASSTKNQKEQHPLSVAPSSRKSDDDIFQDAGSDYVPTVPKNGESPLSEDMEESPREAQRLTYFAEPGYGPAPPPPMDQDWPQQGSYDVLQGPVLPAYQGEWQGYPAPSTEAYINQWPADQYTYPDHYIHSQIPDYSLQPTLMPTKDPRFMTQEEKDRGLGSVFKRDDERLQQRRERDAREKDPNFISESYSECYPGYQEYNREIVDSDDEEDLTKMDMGGRAKGRLHRWDFETEEEWAKYNEQKEAMPKAAFQFGVKMQDGRKTRKQNKDQKLTNELHKINQILERKKDKTEKVNNAYDSSIVYDNEKAPVKRLRV